MKQKRLPLLLHDVRICFMRERQRQEVSLAVVVPIPKGPPPSSHRHSRNSQ